MTAARLALLGQKGTCQVGNPETHRAIIERISSANLYADKGLGFRVWGRGRCGAAPGPFQSFHVQMQASRFKVQGGNLTHPAPVFVNVTSRFRMVQGRNSGVA